MIYAEDMNYWKTSSSGPDAWIDKAKREIARAGGKITGEAFGAESGRSAYMLSFAFDEHVYRVVWPVLPVRVAANERCARIQAATMLYHDVKHRCVLIKVFGAREAFFQFLVLPDGRTAAQLVSPALIDRWPKLLTE